MNEVLQVHLVFKEIISNGDKNMTEESYTESSIATAFDTTER